MRANRMDCQDLRWKTAVEQPTRYDALGAEHGWARGATMVSHLGGVRPVQPGLERGQGVYGSTPVPSAMMR
jgi:hypothetical protein